MWGWETHVLTSCAVSFLPRTVLSCCRQRRSWCRWKWSSRSRWRPRTCPSHSRANEATSASWTSRAMSSGCPPWGSTAPVCSARTLRWESLACSGEVQEPSRTRSPTALSQWNLGCVAALFAYLIPATVKERLVGILKTALLLFRLAGVTTQQLCFCPWIPAFGHAGAPYWWPIDIIISLTCPYPCSAASLCAFKRVSKGTDVQVNIEN